MKRSPNQLLLLSLALSCALSTPGSGDIVLLKNGNEIQGEVLKEDDRQIVVKFSGGILRLRPKDVKRILRQERDQYFLEEGEKQLRRGDYAAAVESFSEALRADAGSLRAKKKLFAARLRLGASLREIGRYKDARDVLEKLREAAPDREDVRAELGVLERTLRDAQLQEAHAVAQLERGNVDGAIERLEKLYDHFPDRREEIGRHLADALVRKGDRHFLDQEWEDAAERYLSAITIRRELLPDVRKRFVVAKLKILRALTENGDFVALETAAHEALQVAPADGPLRYYYGLAQEGQGKARAAAEEYLVITDERRPADPEKAVGDLRRSAERKLLEANEIARTAHPEASRVIPGDFRAVESRRFKVIHKNDAIAREVVTVAERAYDELYRRLGCSTHLLSKVEVTVYPTREEYASTSSDIASWSGGSHRVRRRPMGLSQHAIACYQDQPGLLTETIPHEVAHCLLNDRLGNPKNGIPLWANEGFAIVVEPNYVHRYYRRLVAQELTRRNLMALDDLTGRAEYPEENVSLFYAQSFSLVEFLIGQEDVATFVKLLWNVSKDGVELDAALQRHYKLRGVTALETRWKAWAQRGFRG